MADLKKCPFCGSEATFRHIFWNPDKCMVGCRGCDVVIDGVFPNELEAAKKWNDQVLADEIAELRAENEELKADNERMWYELYDRLRALLDEIMRDATLMRRESRADLIRKTVIKWLTENDWRYKAAASERVGNDEDTEASSCNTTDS